MLRITKRAAATRGQSFDLEGRLVGPWVDELKRVLDGAESSAAVTIDARGRAFADRAGVELLRRLRDGGVDIVGASSFVDALIGAGRGGGEEDRNVG